MPNDEGNPNDGFTAANTPEEPVALVVPPLDPELFHSNNVTRTKKIGALMVALAKAQGEFVTVGRGNTAKIEGKRGDPDFNGFAYKYAELSDFIDMARPGLAKHGLAVIQPAIIDGDGFAVVQTELHHGESEQWMSTLMYLRPEKPDVKGKGSAITYARRYAYAAILGITSAKDDDDGTAAAGQKGKFSRDGRNGAPPEAWGDDNPFPPEDGYGHGQGGPQNGPPQNDRGNQRGNDRKDQRREERREQRREERKEQRQQASNEPPLGLEQPPSGPIPGAIKTPGEAKERIAELAKGKPPEPGEKGPNDLANAIESFRHDFPALEAEAIKILVDGYGADPNNPSVITKPGTTYEAAHAELTKEYIKARRRAQAPPNAGNGGKP